MVERKVMVQDLHDKTSSFYIREKVEVSIVAERLAGPWLKYCIIAILIFYMYGAICLKYVAGAESFVQGVALTIWDSEAKFRDFLHFDPYYLGIIIFGALSIYFSFGNIEDAKTF